MRSPCSIATCLVLLACAAPLAGNGAVLDLEYLEQPISQVDELADGGLAIAFGPSARSFVIDPELSPEFAALVTFARNAAGTGRPVHATIWVRDRSPKTPPPGEGPQPAFVVVRLADTPDPRGFDR